MQLASRCLAPGSAQDSSTTASNAVSPHKLSNLVKDETHEIPYTTSQHQQLATEYIKQLHCL